MEGKGATQPDTLSAALTGAADLLIADPGGATEQSLEILDYAPGQAQALLLLVSARRAVGDMAGAREMLEAFADAHPKLASIQYELALLLGSLGEHEKAIVALRRVVQLEPNHPGAWRVLGDFLATVKKPGAAAEAYGKHLAIAGAELRLMEDATASLDGLSGAEAMLREFLKIHPTDVYAIRLLASVGMRLDRDDDAEKLLNDALEVAPSFTLARHMLAWNLCRQVREDEANRELDILLEKEPDKREYIGMKAMALLMVGEYEQAIAYYRRLTQTHPRWAMGWANYGHALKTVGRSKEAIGAIRHATSVDPGVGDSWWTLASLKTFRFTPDEIATMRRQLERSDLTLDSRIQIHHALGKALEDEGSYAEAFDQYALANGLRRKNAPYNPDHNADTTKRSIALFTSDFLKKRAAAGCPARDPIFIVGMTRAGSTLIEQILASHSMVEGTKELRMVNYFAVRLRERSKDPDLHYPEILESIEPAEFARIGEEFLARAQTHRKTGRPFFIDKTPGNLHHLGFIHLILPNAKIIDARRHPLGCGFANFRHYFPNGQYYTCDLGDIGRYYRDYVRRLAHFDAALPGRVHRVFYEDMVDDPEREVRRLLEYCELPFEEECLRFHETKRAILTPSSEQVRQPIFRQGTEQWRPFEPWLGPLKQALGDVLTAYPDVPEFSSRPADA